MVDDTATWIPPTDIYEIDDCYVLNAELSGVEGRDIKVEFSGLKFTILGERRLNPVCTKENYQRLEGHRGKFHRTFSLPEPVDSRYLQMEFNEGVLHVVLPKLGITRSRSTRGTR